MYPTQWSIRLQIYCNTKLKEQCNNNDWCYRVIVNLDKETSPSAMIAAAKQKTARTLAVDGI